MKRQIKRGVTQVKGSPGQYRGVFVCPFCEAIFPVAGRPKPLDKCLCGAVVNGWPWIEKESKLMPKDSDDDEDTAVDIDISEI